MILSEDEDIKKQTVDDIDQLPLTVELLKLWLKQLKHHFKYDHRHR